MFLIFVRHGESHVNLKEWDQGNLDVGLTVLGQRQADALAQWLPHKVPQIHCLYASTMLRARETAERLARAYDCAIQLDGRLREIGNNRLDHTPWSEDELPNQYADYWASARPFAPTVKSEGGENFMQFRARVGHFIEEMIEQHRGQTILVVCHGGVVESAFHHLFNLGPWVRCEVWDHNTGISAFELVEHPGREVWRLHYHNRIDHLRDVVNS